MDKSKTNQIRKRALRILRTECREEVIICNIDCSDPSKTDKPVYRIHAALERTPNEPSIAIILNEDGNRLNLEEFLKTEGKDFFERKDIGTVISKLRPAQVPQPPSITPDRNEFTLGLGQVKQERIRVTLPSLPAAEKLDIYFLADVTGSMDPVLRGVQNSANAILNAIRALGTDVAFGVGSYGDFPGPPPAFVAQQRITLNDPDVVNAIAAWNANDGGDLPEGQLFALDRIAANTDDEVGWRPGSKRIVLWFGDAPGHEPVCTTLTGLPSPITTISVADTLFQADITVIAISVDTGSGLDLDSDPTFLARDYNNACGNPGGFPGQASTIAGSTGGLHLTAITPDAIVQAIIDSVGEAAGLIGEVRLDPVPSSGQFVTHIQPPEYNSLPAGEENTLDFLVTFEGVVECTDEEQPFLGRLVLRVEGVAVAEKFLKITVPACGDEDDDDEVVVPDPDPIPEPVPEEYEIEASPSAVVSRRDIGGNNVKDQVTILVKGTANDLLSCSNNTDPENPISYQWERLGKPSGVRVTDSPFAVSSDQPHVNLTSELIHALVKGSNGHLYERQFNGSQWIDWIDYGQPNWQNSVAASPAALTYRASYLVEGDIFEDDYYLNQTDDHVYKFVWGTDGLLYRHDQGWLTRRLHQADVGSAAGVARSNYHMYAYVVGNDRNLYVNHSTTLQADAWVWRNLGKPDADANIGALWFRRPGSAHFRFGNRHYFYTFVTGTDGHLWVHRWPGHQPQIDAGEWTDLGRPGPNLSVRSAAAVVSVGDRLYAFVRGSDNNLHVSFWDDPQGAWRWSNLGSPSNVLLRNDPAAITFEQAGKDPIYVYIRGNDSHLHLCHLNATAANFLWKDLSGP